MARLDPQFLPVDDFPESGMDRIHPATQHLHDTGFGPISEVGDEPMRSEWRLWVILAGLCVLWTFLMYWIAGQFSAISDWVSSLA